MSGTFSTDESTRAPDPLVGRVLAGRYDILRLLGEGGMGRVYEGRQRALDRPVAVKCIHPHLLATENMVVRFMEEARVASQLVHPNIVKIYDFGRSDPSVSPTFFLVMELLTGPDLGTVIQNGALPVVRTYSISKQVLSALGEAHARGITHRDAKPDNVILEPTVGGGERVKIIDFGIAKVHGGRGVTAVGQFVGTPQYMPPEQIRGESAEVSSDLYAVGVALFQMLTGRLPFQGETVTEVLEQQLYATRPDPRRFGTPTTCPDGLAEVCLRALHVDPGARYPTADAFSEALDLAVSDVLPPRSRRSPYPPPPASYSRPRPASLPPSAPPSAPPSSGPRLADLSVAERIEKQADAEVRAGRLDSAAAELRRGLAIGRCWIEAGDVEIGGVALAVFGRKLGSVLRAVGRLDESERALRSALEHSDPEEVGRAYVLFELATTLAERGRIGDAEACRVEALRIATSSSDRELTARLRRLAQSFAVAVAAHGTTPTGPRSVSPSPSPHRSEWRFKPDLGEIPDEPSVRRRR